MVSLDGEIQNLPVDASLNSTFIENADPIREFYAWQHKRNYEGYWYSTTTGTHLRFESLLERQYLLSADHAPEVTSISAQPLALLWPAKASSPEGKAMRYHVPDFFYRNDKGDGFLLDVRHPDKASDPHFDLTQTVCNEIGWHYTVFTGVPSPFAESLDWLAGYRMDRFAPSLDTRAGLLEIFATELPLRAGVHGESRRTGLAREVVLGNVLYMLFHGWLHFDRACPLTMASTVWIGLEMSS